METRAKNLVNQNVPWNKDVKWPIVAVEAAILIVIGAFVLIDKDTAADVILQLIGVILLATSVIVALACLRRAELTLEFFDPFRAGIGITAGAIATAAWWSDYISDHAVRIILGWALVAYTLLHVVGLVRVRGRAGLGVNQLIASGFSLILGILLLTGEDTASSTRLNLLGTVLLVVGLLLAALAYYLYKGASKATDPVADQVDTAPIEPTP
ncbi:MAG TPA: hypothetical protein VEW66_00250 [Thermomicrobiales bacterium]|nr:hypothetical protein [Thermomicrobiales bacterium]